jgi:DNA polymerase-3 subunit delta'
MARILSQLVGHESAVNSIIEAIEQGKLAQTLLFAGASGVGKKMAALAVAQILVCERRGSGRAEACGECGACVRLEKGQSESLLLVEPDGLSIKAEQAHGILQFLTLRKLGRARVVIIDQAHLLNPQAGNALLKSLEEPPEGTYFILITSNPAAVLSTIRSRSQLVRFRPLRDEELRRILGAEIDDWALSAAHGSVEVAKRIAESRAEYKELEGAVENFLRSAATGLALNEVSRLKEMIKDKPSQVFVAGLIQCVVRDALRAQAGLSVTSPQAMAALAAELSRGDSEGVKALADLSLEFEQDFMRNVDRGLVLENFAIRWRDAVASDGRGA